MTCKTSSTPEYPGLLPQSEWTCILMIFFISGEAFIHFMWPVVLIIDELIGMGFLKMEWTDANFNLKSKWREFHTQREKGILPFLRNAGWWDVVIKVLCERATPCINWGQGKGWSLSSGGKTEVFQPTDLHYRQSELSVGNGNPNRIPATAIELTKWWRSNTDLF